MTNAIHCDQFAEQLADLLERTLDDATRTQLEAHALSCGTCGPLLGDLRKLQSDAANLPELVPSRDLWSGIAARIETPVVEITHGGTVERWNGKTRSKLWLGLAAAGLVAVTATITHVMTKRSLSVQSTPAVASLPSGDTANAVVSDTTPSMSERSSVPASHDSTVPSFHRSTVPPFHHSAVLQVSNRLTAEQTYDQEIARLRLVLAARRPHLDSATVAVIDHNLQVIDDAIAQCRQALEKDPASHFLIESLDGAMNDKVRLLRTAAQLPVRT